MEDSRERDMQNTMTEEQVALLQNRYGGYWRYPELVDFCYLVNPYFPPRQLMEEIKAQFEILLTQYPSGMDVNSRLAAAYFGVAPENILVGNGAAELIKALMERLDGKVGVIRPTFEEYPNRCPQEDTVVYTPEKEDFSYEAEALMSFFQGKVKHLVLINPDNPSGNYIPKTDLLQLTQWAREQGIHLIVDESFSDFAEEGNNTLIVQKFLDQNPHVSVMKSISKCYGVPGLRLGVLASGNRAMIAALKKEVAIWNINSFAESYLQTAGKYKQEYALALNEFRRERARFVALLQEIPGIRVLPSQANYLMLEITNGMAAKTLTQRLLEKYQLFVKDLSGKIRRDERQFLRVAVRNTKDNNKLAAAMQKELTAGKENV